MGALWEERGEAADGTGGACGALALPGAFCDLGREGRLS